MSSTSPPDVDGGFQSACEEMARAFAAVEHVAAAAEFVFDTAAADLLAREMFRRLSARRSALLIAQMRVAMESFWEAVRMSQGLTAALTAARASPARGSA